MGKESACNIGDTGDVVGSLGQEDPLEKEMTTDSNILAWEIQWTEEPSGLHSPWGPKGSDMTECLSTQAFDERSHT